MNHRNNLNKLIRWMAFAVLLGMIIFGCASVKPTQQEVENELSEVTPPESTVDDIIVNESPVDYDDVLEDVIIVNENPVDDISNKEINAGLSPQKPSRPVKKYDAVDVDENPVEDIPEEGEAGLSPQKPRSLKAEQFNAIIEATKNIKLGTSGTLKVWIGWEKYIPKQGGNTVIDTTSWYSYFGTYARITPVAKNFIIEPNEPIVLKIDSTGSGFQYSITPKERGEFEVSAIIELFDNEECLGPPVIKPTQVLSVKVEVGYLDEIWAPVWSNFTRFWGAFVALFFAALLFVIRKFVKKKTGYSEEKNDNALEEGNDEVTEDENEMPNDEEGEKEIEESEEINEETGEENEMPNDEEGGEEIEESEEINEETGEENEMPNDEEGEKEIEESEEINEEIENENEIPNDEETEKYEEENLPADE